MIIILGYLGWWHGVGVLTLSSNKMRHKSTNLIKDLVSPHLNFYKRQLDFNYTSRSLSERVWKYLAIKFVVSIKGLLVVAWLYIDCTVQQCCVVLLTVTYDLLNQTMFSCAKQFSLKRRKLVQWPTEKIGLKSRLQTSQWRFPRWTS